MNNCKYCKADCALRGEENLKECNGHIPMTNADRIRAMNDYDLAVFFAKTKAALYRADLPVIAYSTQDMAENLEWLQQPAEGETNETDM